MNDTPAHIMVGIGKKLLCVEPLPNAYEHPLLRAYLFESTRRIGGELALGAKDIGGDTCKLVLLADYIVEELDDVLATGPFCVDHFAELRTRLHSIAAELTEIGAALSDDPF